MPNVADQIRLHVLTHHIQPARAQGVKQVTIRSGDIHQKLGFQNRIPAVCSALAAKSFETMADVRLSSRQGPHTGANTVFTYDLI
ncbi:hypothetical protein D3C87_1390820 [compost metagenome]